MSVRNIENSILLGTIYSIVVKVIFLIPSYMETIFISPARPKLNIYRTVFPKLRIFNLKLNTLTTPQDGNKIVRLMLRQRYTWSMSL